MHILFLETLTIEIVYYLNVRTTRKKLWTIKTTMANTIVMHRCTRTPVAPTNLLLQAPWRAKCMNDRLTRNKITNDTGEMYFIVHYN